jgi:hypothetical protein
MYDYIVAGGGPTGITLSLMLSQTNYKVLVLEKSDSLGGCWKVEYLEETYMTEHSPKVLFRYSSKYFKKLLKILDVEPKFKSVYFKSKMKNMILSIQFLLYNLTIRDYIMLCKYYIQYIFNIHDRHINVNDWCIKNKISKSGTKCIDILSITINNIPKRFRFEALFVTLLDSKAALSIDQLSHPNEWIEKAEAIIENSKNITVMYDSKVTKVIEDEDIITQVLVNNLEYYSCSRDVFLCVPIQNVLQICKSSNIMTNWFLSSEEFEYYTQSSTLNAIGIQLHFDKQMKQPEKWFWSQFSPWNIILVDKSNTMEVISYDKNVKSVWSCVLIDLESKGENKSVNECKDKKEIEKEVLLQLEKLYKSELRPIIVTFADIKRKDGKWYSEVTSFSDMYGDLKPKGKINNLYSIGPHNIRGAVTIDNAIKSALNVSVTHDFPKIM